MDDIVITIKILIIRNLYFNTKYRYYLYVYYKFENCDHVLL